MTEFLLMQMADGSDAESGSGEDDSSSKQVYKPAKLAPVYYGQ
jgi:hypothetical protein